jgi:hypothetical protein
MKPDSAAAVSPPTAPRRRRPWVLFFVVLFLLAVAAVALEISFNLWQQLTPARLQQARTLWQEKGPASYNLQYTVTSQTRMGNRLTARVKGGDVTALEVNGEPLDPELFPFHDVPGLLAEWEHQRGEGSDAAERDLSWTSLPASTVTYEVAVRRAQVVRAEGDRQPLPPQLRGSYGMAGLFRGIARLLEHDAHAGGWHMFNVAVFDPDEGRLLHYVRSNSLARERIELKAVQLETVAEDAPVP